MSSPGEYETSDGRHVFDGDQQLTSAESDKGTRAIRMALARWGEPFLAYLLLPNVEPDARDIDARFIDCYAGYYESRSAFVDAQISSLGWHEALEAFRHDQGIWDDDLQWNYDELYAHCCEVYTVSERFGGVHVFLR